MDIPKHEKCKNCGACCGPILATQSEIESIKEFVNKMPKVYREKLKKQKRKFLTCQFRDMERKRCVIYSVRPIICKLFGVTRGMNCKYGNSQEIEGIEFLPKEPPRPVPRLL